jgi:hypothetical protein
MEAVSHCWLSARGGAVACRLGNGRALGVSAGSRCWIFRGCALEGRGLILSRNELPRRRLLAQSGCCGITLRLSEMGGLRTFCFGLAAVCTGHSPASVRLHSPMDFHLNGRNGSKAVNRRRRHAEVASDVARWTEAQPTLENATRLMLRFGDQQHLYGGLAHALNHLGIWFWSFPGMSGRIKKRHGIGRCPDQVRSRFNGNG